MRYWIVFLLCLCSLGLIWYRYENHLEQLIPNECRYVAAQKSGFGHNILTIVHGMTLMEKENLQWDFNKSPYCFKTYFNLSFQDSKKCRPLNYKMLYRLSDIKSVSLLPGCPELCSNLLSIWNLNPMFNNKMREVRKEMTKFSVPHILLHVRGGDKLKSEIPKSYDYSFERGLIRAKKNWPSVSTGNGTCFIIGDDFDLSQYTAFFAKKYLNCSVVNYIQPGYKHIQSNYNQLITDRRCSLTLQLLLDIELLAIMPYTLALGLSNVVRLAALLQGCRTLNSSTILDWGGKDINIDKCLL